MNKRLGIIFGSLLISSAVALADPAVLPVYTVAMPVGQTPDVQCDTWLLHLPGIAGRRGYDEQMELGFKDAGFRGALQIYDWTGENTGLRALRAYKQNQIEAQKVADHIAERFHKQPGLHIVLTGHSGGTGIAVWALEKLPDDVKIDELILLASALSPDYDLSKALAHVRGTCYAFSSKNDILALGAGTKLFGTIDGKKTVAAGEGGFVQPKDADTTQYAKLIQKQYDKAWVQYQNRGDHMGCMARPFAEKVIAQLLPVEKKATDDAAKHPAGAQQSSGDQKNAGRS